MALEKMKITGGKRLEGEITISGAKNATLPVLAATLLTSKPCRLTNVPDLMDIETMLQILRTLGAKIERSGNTIEIEAKGIEKAEAPYEFVRKMRASVLLLGPVLSRTGYARVALPGGCAIGVRPIDLHLKALEALGAKIHLTEGYVEAKAKRLHGVEHTFDFVTVTGTMNAMLAASLAEGETVLKNCAREPEIDTVAEALTQMGAKVSGAGTGTIVVNGCSEPVGFDVEMIPDRIATGTYLMAGAITEGSLFLRNARKKDLEAVIEKIQATGTEVMEDPNGLRVVGKRPIRCVDVRTEPHPGFPTDMQAQFVTLLALAKGTSSVTETIFENRFMHVPELSRMGANLKIEGPTVHIQGVDKLHGAPVMATDLRASASLVLAGLAAQGDTEVSRIYHLDRGYEKMDEKLRNLGANIQRIQV